MKNLNTLRAEKNRRIAANNASIARDRAHVAKQAAGWTPERKATAQRQIDEQEVLDFSSYVFKIYANRAAEFGIDLTGLTPAPGTFTPIADKVDGHDVLIYWPKPSDVNALIHFGPD